MEPNHVPHGKNVSSLNNIALSSEMGIVVLYTHFMSNSQSKWNFVPHSHTFHELHIVLNGACQMDLNGKSVYLGRHSCVLISPDEQHLFKWCSDDFFRFSITFTVTDENKALSVKAADAFTLNARSVSYIESILWEYEQKKLGCNSAVNAFICNLLIEILRSPTIVFPDISMKMPLNSVLGKALRFIENNLSRGVTVKDVADDAYISVRQLNRIFVESLNMTVTQCIKSKRINLAKEYLTQTRLSVKEIAFLTGFDDAASLCKAFRREVGVSPKDYRLTN